ncbi:methyltransferase [Hyphomonas sp.]|uniref:methyltransferase n=1 Tax=Hyphomonas sp. TaxID=87 RepID=UPI00391B1772
MGQETATAGPGSMSAEQDPLLGFAAKWDAYLRSDIDMTISPDETMRGFEWYHTVGKAGARAVILACMSSQLTDVRSLLDMPCGHGRVLRHLVKLFPDAQVDACDIDRKGAEFCARQFGAGAIISEAEPEAVVFPRKYDVIWVGSLLTHTTLELTERWLRHLAMQLSDTGIIAATVHGRYSARRGGEFGYIDAENWQRIVAEYEETGYGYANYPFPAHGGNVPGDYGVSLSKASRLISLTEGMDDLRIFNYIERGWGGHQDLLVVGKPRFIAGLL